MKVSRKRIFVAAGVVVLLVVLLVAADSDDHHTNAKYLLWKWGLAPSFYRAGVRYMNVDGEFRDSLRGKTLPEVSELFPVLETPSHSPLWRREYNAEMNLTGEDTRWIADSQWALRLRKGRIIDIELYKG